MANNKHADVVIVGMGAVGAILARELTEAGFTVLGIDKGPYYRSDDFWTKFDELRYSTRGGLSPTMDTDPITWRPNAQTPAQTLPWAVGPQPLNPLWLPPTPAVGGGSIHWACWAWRQHKEDFRQRSEWVERYGEDRFPEGSHIVDWPVSYDDLEPYYDRVEYETGVSGKAGNLDGELQDGGNPFEAPRKRPYPFPPLRPSASNQLFVDACEALGYHPFPAPAAIISEDWGERKACVYCGFCRDYACHVGAKTTTLDTMMPKALATGNLKLLTNCRVQRVNVDAEGLARSVSYIDAKGERHEASGELVILSAYSLENTRLMLVSGLNQNGMVGKWFTIHNYGWFSGTLPEETHVYAGPAVAGWAIDDTNPYADDRDEVDFLGGTPIMFFGGDTQPIEAASPLMPPDVPLWGKEYKEWLRHGYRRLFGIFSQMATLPSEANFVDLDPKVKDPWGQPALRITHDWDDNDRKAALWNNQIKHGIAREMGATKTWEAPLLPPYHVTTHEMGTHAMGENPNDSVVDRYCRSHEVPNLFLVGGGVFPTYNGYNPTLTIQTIALWAANHIKQETQNGGVLTRFSPTERVAG
jgi:gluconate 2-dehydrogenase alpha chain